LAKLDPFKALELAAPLLESDHEGIRRRAAAVLCRLGSGDGVAALLAKDRLRVWPVCGQLNTLNALRRQELWMELEEKTLKGELRGSLDELLKKIAEQAGMKLDAGWSQPGPLTSSWKPRRDIRLLRGGTSLLEAIEQALDQSGHGFLLERGRIRVLSREPLVEFWRKWGKK
ncbi:MAG: hypothetical protein ACYTAF_02660, partial [Planctomycetota bacterium]